MDILLKFFSRLYAVVVIFFSLLLPQVLISIQVAINDFWNTFRRSTCERKYLQLIEKKSSKFVYRRRLRPDLVDCAICLSNFVERENVRELQCRHTFHRDCLDTWLQRDRPTCPICRSLVLPEEAVAERRRLRQEHDNSEEEQALAVLSLLYGTRPFAHMGFSRQYSGMSTEIS